MARLTRRLEQRIPAEFDDDPPLHLVAQRVEYINVQIVRLRLELQGRGPSRAPIASTALPERAEEERGRH